LRRNRSRWVTGRYSKTCPRSRCTDHPDSGCSSRPFPSWRAGTRATPKPLHRIEESEGPRSSSSASGTDGRRLARESGIEVSSRQGRGKHAILVLEREGALDIV